ncbi:hypothetical protein [Actinotignum urinale]|uniref:hypothetical protein n=1 Tax=Actinotignum urinale TaxID=190146 RepID=UPI0003B4B271|nr:hypothetical protein [Actinotignum urinale]MDY5159562.1 hypothetical protein [Actinotignum urinale]
MAGIQDLRSVKEQYEPVLGKSLARVVFYWAERTALGLDIIEGSLLDESLFNVLYETLSFAHAEDIKIPLQYIQEALVELRKCGETATTWGTIDVVEQYLEHYYPHAELMI